MRIDYRTIKKKTRCTEEQAKQIADAIRKLPKIQKTFMSHIGEINLQNCTRVEVRMVNDYMDDEVNICAYRKIPELCFTLFGEEHISERLHRYSLSSVLNKVFYSVF